ncbi:hypothetical protein HCB29_16515 [Listeria booriae]|nr:hypothetical protein [Listeria booriae]
MKNGGDGMNNVEAKKLLSGRTVKQFKVEKDGKYILAQLADTFEGRKFMDEHADWVFSLFDERHPITRLLNEYGTTLYALNKLNRDVPQPSLTRVINEKRDIGNLRVSTIEAIADALGEETEVILKKLLDYRKVYNDSIRG